MKRILQFLGITFLISWAIKLVAYLVDIGILPTFFKEGTKVAVLGPLIAFLFIIKLDKKSIKEEVKKLFKPKTNKWLFWFVIISPIIISFLSYLLLVLITGASFTLGLSLQMIPLIAVIILVTGGPFEEFGWRGFLMPEIRKRYGFILTILIVGIIHGIWHIPLHFIDGTVQNAMPIWQFLAITVLITVSYGFVLEYTKDIKPMIILHWISNLSSAVFIYWQENTGRYLIFIITIILDSALIFYYYNKKQKQLKAG